MTTSFNWVKRIGPELSELNTIPLFGNAVPFDWSFFSSSVAATFDALKVDMRPHHQGWQNGSDIKKQLGSEVHVLPIFIAPVGKVYWMMSKKDRAKLTGSLVKPGYKSRSPLSEIFQEGFYRFILLEVLDQLSQVPPFNEFTLQISSEEEEYDKAFCIDVEIAIEEKICWGRLVLPKEFRSKWVEHFANTQSEYFPRALARQTFLNLSLKIGGFSLKPEEWETVEVGDFILLDHGSYDPRKGSGSCFLMLNATPIFNTKIRHEQIELIDYAFYYEDPMKEEEKTPGEGETISIKETPLYITVEIARLKMTLDQLMHLTPGNTLELPIHPDQGVRLSVNGGQVARAELVHLGEQLGVRILEI